MSIVDTYKNEFKIVIFDEDLKRSENTKEALAKNNFNLDIFNSRGLLTESLKGDLPHVFVLYYQPLNMKFRELVTEIRRVSDEVQIVLLGAKDFWPGIQKLVESGVANDYWSYPFAGAEEFSLRLEKLIEKDIYRFVAEQRSEETAAIVSNLEKVGEVPQFQPSSPAAFDSNDIMGLISQNHRTEPDIINELMKGLKQNYVNSEFIYFKNYRAKDQLLVTSTSFSSENYFRGQSIPFSEERMNLNESDCLNQLRDSIGEQFSIDKFTMQPVSIANDIFGFIVAVNCENSNYVKKAAKYLAISLRNFSLEKGERTVDIDNSLEIKLAKSQFPLALSNEISRARRLKLPVSLIIGQIDYIGEQDTEFAKAFDKIKNTLRSYDFISQLDENRVAIIMPHCTYEDAAIKAETVRRQLVAMGLKSQNTPLRLCFGVSEYPSLSLDSDSLIADTEKACQQVMVSGKNKVCLYTAEENHEPDFQLQV